MTAPTDAVATETGAYLHTLLATYSHYDRRMCGYHSRLGQWIVMGDPASDVNVFELPETYACTREHV